MPKLLPLIKYFGFVAFAASDFSKILLSYQKRVQDIILVLAYVHKYICFLIHSLYNAETIASSLFGEKSSVTINKKRL